MKPKNVLYLKHERKTALYTDSVYEQKVLHRKAHLMQKLLASTAVAEGFIYFRHDLLGTLLQSHTQPLLEGEDLLQFSTQRGAVRSTQPEIPNIECQRK